MKTAINKIFYLISIVILVTFSACGGKEDEPDAQHDSRLVGKWILELSLEDNGDGVYNIYNFKSNGKMTLEAGDIIDGCHENSEITTGKWETSGYNLLIEYYDPEEGKNITSMSRYKVSENTLYLTNSLTGLTFALQKME